jgi:hypothetical protein
MAIATVGLDTSKSWFQLHCVDENGELVLRRKLSRGKILSFFANLPRCVVGLEACGSAHHWARELSNRYLRKLLIHGTRAPSSSEQSDNRTVDHRTACPTSLQRRDGCARQQDSTHSMGRDGKRGHLSRESLIAQGS